MCTQSSYGFKLNKTIINVVVCYVYAQTSGLNDAYTKSELARNACFLSASIFHPQELSPSP